MPQNWPREGDGEFEFESSFYPESQGLASEKSQQSLEGWSLLQLSNPLGRNGRSGLPALGSKSFDKVEKDQVVSEGKSSLVQSHFAIGEEVAEGGRRVGAKFAPGIHNSPPPCQVVRCCEAVGGCSAGKCHNTFWNSVYNCFPIDVCSIFL